MCKQSCEQEEGKETTEVASHKSCACQDQIYPLIKCELKITKTWEAHDMEKISEESSDEGSKLIVNEDMPMR